jgi:hypothetical protein
MAAVLLHFRYRLLNPYHNPYLHLQFPNQYHNPFLNPFLNPYLNPYRLLPVIRHLTAPVHSSFLPVLPPFLSA